MGEETLFLICTYGVIPGWVLLALAPGWRYTDLLVHRVWIPVLLGIAYVYAAIVGLPQAPEGSGFGTLPGVLTLFSNPVLMLAGWIHFLAFDLFLGAWQVRDARRNEIPHLLVVPCLVLTLLFGPSGFLLYLAIRYGMRRKVTLAEAD